jgi:hypothetical protein
MPLRTIVAEINPLQAIRSALVRYIVAEISYLGAEIGTKTSAFALSQKISRPRTEKPTRQAEPRRWLARRSDDAVHHRNCSTSQPGGYDVMWSETLPQNAERERLPRVQKSSGQSRARKRFGNINNTQRFNVLDAEILHIHGNVMPVRQRVSHLLDVLDLIHNAPCHPVQRRLKYHQQKPVFVESSHTCTLALLSCAKTSSVIDLAVSAMEPYF